MQFKNIKTVYVHIGTMKTATSSIQDTLYENQEILKKNNFLYPSELRSNHSTDFNRLFNTNEYKSDTSHKLGIDKNIINRSYIDTITNARKLFLKRFSEEHKTVINKTLAVAEAGVYRGEFAKSINQYFPNSPLYLFDTFEGFNNLDFVHEEDESLLDANHFKNTSVEHVIDRMPFASNCLIRKGYFPETTVDIHDDFIFVSLDLDLYKPTLEGLIFFYPKLVQGGCILIHDYFMASYPNVKKAVEEYQNSYHTNLVKIPIGDDLSIAIIKT